MITAAQLVAHAVGDYVLQSDWMASEKTERSWPAGLHAVTYALPFLFLTRAPLALAVIVGTHFIIDRWRLARYVVWLKNHLAPRSWWRPWIQCCFTGYPNDRPQWMTLWLLILADNVMHVLLNGVAIEVFRG